MIRSFPFKSINGDRKYCADDFALHDKTLYTSGIIGNQNNNLQVFSNEGMSIKISPGFALIEGHTFVNSNDYFIDIEYAGNRFTRIDRLVLRLDHTNREIVPYLKKGKDSTSPKAPSLQRDADIFEIALADITVERGAISITQGNIRDLRHTSLCGISSFRGKPINVEDIYIQYEDNLKEIVNILRKDLNNKQDLLNNLVNNFDSFVNLNKDEILLLIKELNSLIEEEGVGGKIVAHLSTLEQNITAVNKALDNKASREYVDREVKKAGKVQSVNNKIGDVELYANNIEMSQYSTQTISSKMTSIENNISKKADKEIKDSRTNKKYYLDIYDNRVFLREVR